MDTKVTDNFMEYYRIFLETLAITFESIQDEVIKMGSSFIYFATTGAPISIRMEDVKLALLSISNNKSLGPDGYNSDFFKVC